MLPAISVGVVFGVILIFFAILFGVLVFSGPLAPFVSQGIGMMVFGAFAICLTIALAGGYRGSISIQSTPSVMALATIGPAIALEGEALFATMVAIMIVGAVATGVCLAAIGQFRLASLLRFVPYPVACGVLAGTGGLCFMAALSMMQVTPDWQVAHSLLESSALWSWGPGVAYGLGLLLITKRWTNPWILPASFVLCSAIFHIGLSLLGVSEEQAKAWSLLFADMMDGTIWPPLHPGDLAHVDWMAVVVQIPKMLAWAVVTLLCGVIYLSSFELAANREIDWNREFRAAGGASVISGLGGGPAGSMSSPLSMLNHRYGVETRLTGIVAALAVGSVLLFNDLALTSIPVPLLAGMLLFVGVGMLDEWLAESRKRLPPTDYAIVLAIFVTVVFVGFAEGVAVGMAITTVLFAARLSRVDSVEAEFTARERSSNRSRRIANRAILLAEGDRVHGYRLRGHLFFGSAHALASRLKQSLDRDPPPACILLDFEAVSGLDFSAVNALCGFIRASHDSGVRVALAGAPENCRTGLERNLPSSVFADLMFETDPDRALERGEDIVIAAQRSDLRQQDESGDALLDRFAGDIERHLDRRIQFEDMAHELREWLEVRDYESGEALVAADAPQDGLQLLLLGRASAYETDGARLRQYGPGDAIGVRGAFEARAATTDTVADEPCRTLVLTPVVRRWLEENRARLMQDLYGYLLTADARGMDPPGFPAADAR
ncbi:MAG: SulP family inorganic anion transporter [Defluviicoccus sp.]|nr:SulP family inorganic anion transporter [Defluviicoccus sp.]